MPPPNENNNNNNTKLTEEDGDNGIAELPPEPTSVRSARENPPNLDDDESSPLLGRGTSGSEWNASEGTAASRGPRRSWWTIISIAVLLILTINIIIFAFVVPSATQNYAMQATTYTLHDIEVQEFTDNGLIAKAQVNVTIDSSRVQSKNVRNVGVFITGIFKHVYTQPCIVSVLLPQYNGAQVALVGLPALGIDVRNHHVNNYEIISNVTITNSSLAVQLAGDFLAGKHQEIQTIAEADVHIKAGFIPMGRHHISQQVVVQGGSPKLPEYSISGIDVVDQPGTGTLVTATAEIVNPYPVNVDVPSLAWKVLVPGCATTEAIRLTNADTGPISIKAGHNITVNVSSTISSLPSKLLDPCGDGPSPLEILFQSLIDPKQNTTVLISGRHQSTSLPNWIPDILSSVNISIPVPHLGTNTSDLISAIHVSDMKVTLPPPWAPPGTPHNQPKVSGVIEAIIRPPEEAANVAINVTAVRADVLLFDEGKKFGRVLVPEWSPAETVRKKKIHVIARVAEVPIEVLDPIVFQRVMGKVLQGRGVVEIGVEGTVDGQVSVLVGDFAVRGIPVKGIVEVQGVYPFDDLRLGLVGDIEVLETTKKGISLRSTVKVNNPTKYEAFIPYLDLQLLYNGHLIGNATAVNATISKGTNKIAGAISYSPSTAQATLQGEKFLGDYLSGRNPNVTVLFHDESFPGNPDLSSAFAGFNITLPVPSIHAKKPKDSENTVTPSPFIRSATVHVLSRTAQFELYNPLSNAGILLASLYANATYNDEIIGSILEPDFNFPVLPGGEGYTTTDKIPLEVGSVGYEVIRRALGGELIVDAVADVVVMIGKWRGRIRYHGNGVGASIRL